MLVHVTIARKPKLIKCDGTRASSLRDAARGKLRGGLTPVGGLSAAGRLEQSLVAHLVSPRPGILHGGFRLAGKDADYLARSVIAGQASVR